MANKPRQKKTRAKQSPEAIAEQGIAATRQSNTLKLNLSSLKLTTLPESISQLTQPAARRLRQSTDYITREYKPTHAA